MKSKTKVLWAFISICAALLILFLISVCMGSLQISLPQFLKGIFVEFDDQVATVYDLRLPRIFISMLAGAALAVAGVLMQATMKNPIADPSIIGISSGASFASVVVAAAFPSLFFLTPLFAFAGGIVAFLLVYGLAWNGGSGPLRIILVGVAINAMFTGLLNVFNSFSSGNLSGVTEIINGNITMKTWADVSTLFWYVLIGLILALVVSQRCNLLALEDKTARSLGIHVEKSRFAVSFIAVLLASISTAIVGVIAFLGLIVPHIARLFVGSDHKKLTAFSILLGAFVLLLADTIGRTVAMPYEISAGAIMAIFGGPFFVLLLVKKGKGYAG